MNHQRIFSWSLYDFANTAFSALFVTFFFPKFVKEILGGNEFQIGLVMGLSMFFVGILVPVIGTYSDMTGRRVALIKQFTLACVICTIAVGFVPLSYALVLGGLANFFYHACLVVYNSSLQLVTKGKNIGNISGIGVAVGYLGTVASLIMAVIILQMYKNDTVFATRLMFPATAFFFLIFSLPLFIRIKDKLTKTKKNFWVQVEHARKDAFKTFKKLAHYKGVIPFLLSSFAYSNGITAAIVFLYLYAREKLGIADEQFIVIYMIFAVASAGGSFIGGRVSDRYQPKTTLIAAGIHWCVVLIMLMFPSSIFLFGVAGAIGGAAMGSIWAANRPMIIQLVPKMRIGQFFGFDELADKFSGIIGPILFGWLVVQAGYFWALASMLSFFVIGLVLLYWVPNLASTKRHAR